MHNFEIVFYEKENGEEPAKEFLLMQTPKMRAKLLRILEMLRQNGNTLGEPYTKFLEDGIIVLTNGFVKKTQRTPKKELKKAKMYRIDYERRKHDSI